MGFLEQLFDTIVEANEASILEVAGPEDDDVHV